MVRLTIINYFIFMKPDDDVTTGAHAVVNCRHCNGIILKNIDKEEINGKVSFLTRCSHCQNNIDVIMSRGQIETRLAC